MSVLSSLALPLSQPESQKVFRTTKLVPSIPYAWQDKGRRITLKSQSSQRLNILGVLNTQNELVSEVYLGTTRSERVIQCLDQFSQTLEQTTVVVLDQASIHTSDAMLRN